MSDPLKFTWESMPAIWRCYYDPEGPCGEGKTKAKALEDLWSMCDDETGHREALLWGAIVASIPDVPSDVHGWRWIPVTERLPEPYTFVLAFSPCTNTERVNTARYTGRGGLKDGWITCMDHPVTHWMPLQEPCTARGGAPGWIKCESNRGDKCRAFRCLAERKCLNPQTLGAILEQVRDGRMSALKAADRIEARQSILGPLDCSTKPQKPGGTS